MRKLLSVFSLLGALAFACTAQSESLLLGPGDLIHVEVFDTPEMTREARVTDGGMVPVAFVGELKLGGKTPADAAKLIQTALIDKKVMLHPQVTVTVEEYATQNVSVLGPVGTPGAYPISTPQPILKILSLAGGLTDSADRTVTIERHSDPSQRVTYHFSNDAEHALSDSVLVYPGDTVLVSKAGVVYVMGDVAKPGGYRIATNDSKMTILQAVAMAGSTNKTAVQSSVRLIRTTPQGQQDIPVQLSAIQQGKQPDLPLQANDVLYVPFSWMKNMAISGASIVSSTSSAGIYAIK